MVTFKRMLVHQHTQRNNNKLAFNSRQPRFSISTPHHSSESENNYRTSINSLRPHCTVDKTYSYAMRTRVRVLIKNYWFFCLLPIHAPPTSTRSESTEEPAEPWICRHHQRRATRARDPYPLRAQPKTNIQIASTLSASARARKWKLIMIRKFWWHSRRATKRVRAIYSDVATVCEW